MTPPAAALLASLRDGSLLRRSSYAGGRWFPPSNRTGLAVRDPSSGSVIARVAPADGPDAANAVDAAQAAFAIWRKTSPDVRAAKLEAWGQAIGQARDDLAAILVAEQGKPLREAIGEIDYARGFVGYYAQAARLPQVEEGPRHFRDARTQILHAPAGIAALITPWNFPSAMITRKAAAAMAAGCTVLVAPSPETPLSALALAVLAERAGLPAGVFNVLAGAPRTIVAPWLSDPRVRVLSFTGSTAIGQLLYRGCAATTKRLVLELGGHAPFIVCADADLERAIDMAVSAKFATSGQDCLAANQFLIASTLYDAFCKGFAQRTAALTVGPGRDDPDIGPLIHERAVRRQEAHVTDALARGARLLCGGSRHPAGPNFFTPTLLADVAPDALLFNEETFGPVAGVACFDDVEDAIARANATPYGLAAYVHTGSAATAARFEQELDCGMVAVNRTRMTGAEVPFGGWKNSGLGREGGIPGLRAFQETRYVCRQTQRTEETVHAGQ